MSFSKSDAKALTLLSDERKNIQRPAQRVVASLDVSGTSSSHWFTRTVMFSSRFRGKRGLHFTVVNLNVFLFNPRT
jgi:hypothetical protein